MISAYLDEEDYFHLRIEMEDRVRQFDRIREHRICNGCYWPIEYCLCLCLLPGVLAEMETNAQR